MYLFINPSIDPFINFCTLHSEWYDSDALMMSEECTVVIAGLLMGLNVIDYTISLSGEDFDKPVSYHLLSSVTDHTPMI